jgi:acetylornithine/succinyldiaminopimelate/putrescine aminotransferase
MVGVTLADGVDTTEIAAGGLEQRLVFNVPGQRMLRFLPPLVVDEADIDDALERLGQALGAT